MNSTTGEGRTFEEAVDSAVQQLGVRIDQVHVEVVEEKRGLLFGLFGGKVTVKVTHHTATEDRIDEILSGIMKHLGIPSQVDVSKKGGDYFVNVGTVDSDGLLIGKRGETLHALEHLVNRIVHRDPLEKGRITIDVSGYRTRRDEQLKSQAINMAKKVKESGREMSTDPLYSPDRRVIHLALTGDSEIRTYTSGDGLYKSVVVAPGGSRGGESRDGRRRSSGRRSRGGRGRGRGRGSNRGGQNRGGENRQGGREGSSEPQDASSANRPPSGAAAGERRAPRASGGSES